MAKKAARPGRTLVSFFIGLAIAFGLVALTGTWKPALGLDLEGGTRITLIAKGDPSQESLDEARSIIDSRVNGSGVSEAEVTTGGSGTITVEIPGDERRDLVDVVERQAQLRFRLVACPGAPSCAGTAAPQPELPTGPEVSGEPAPGGQNGGGQNGGGQNGGGAANRPPVGFSDDGTTTPSPEPAPTEPAPTEAPTEATTVVPEAQGTSDVDTELAFARNPDPAAVAMWSSFSCAEDGTLTKADGSPATVVDDPNQPLVACSPPEGSPDDAADYRPSQKYLLSKSVIEGTDLDSASAGIPTGEVQWIVNLEIGGAGRDAFTEISSALVGTGEQFAIVLDGSVISAPEMNGRITNGQAQISGNFNETSANALATSLKFGALPIAFEKDPSSEVIGPSLAGDQLAAGLLAGGFGLGLVLIYCLLYYRGLGLVVVASLLAAAASTYAMVLLLSETANFTLTLPGIAGLIIAVGVTADSFIIFFERIRDEMREGKSMRVAVETGWKRAKVTRLAAQVVSLLSAAVLYIFATGVVKGFGFALGLSTIIDLAILFWFTKPMVSWLARFKFFNSGHKLSGLSQDSLGMHPATTSSSVPVAASAGGKA